ncbi:hypothetical protein [uncultured Legionella sp.]|uniref:hypothetical protein n=1 Tax=uncultured Legionella sp. TaxID=210934 RepID=UPI00260B559F|nr:hypothetical protein [uncultured Legionella sp.]
MPFPKLSAVLNNCPLHALTPEVKNEVVKFAADEHYDNHHNAQYERLKSKFAAFYELHPETFSWKQFANLLEHYNAFDTQIILGPVLRSFMKDAMANEEMVPKLAMVQDIDTESYIYSKTELSPVTSRYASLSPDELFTFVSKHLGFSLTYHPQGKPAVTFKSEQPISEIEIYHQGGIDGAQAGGHWERTNKGEASINVQAQNDTQLDMIIQLLGENPAVNPCGFNLLKKHVQINEQIVEPTFQSDVDCAELNIAATQVLKYLFNINSVPKELAVSLLGKNLSRYTEEFIREYEFEPVPSNQIFERWIKADEGKKPLLNKIQQQLVNFLISKVPQSLTTEINDAKLDRSVLDTETAPSEQLVKELHEQYLSALQEKERLERESELLAQRLSDADKPHALLIAADDEVQSEDSQADLAREEPDPSEQLIKQLLEQERLAIEQEEKDILASELLAKKLTEESYRSVHLNGERDFSEHQTQEQAELQLASEQLAKELEAKRLLEQQEQLKHQLTNERTKHQKTDESSPVSTKENNTDKPHTAKDKMQIITLKIEAQNKFKLQLDLLEKKMDNLAKRKEKHRNNPEQFKALELAWDAANTLHTQLGLAGKTYLNNPTQKTYQTYETRCNKLFKDAHEVLDQHRDWSEFLINMALGVLTLGAGLLVKGAINYAMNKSFFHVHNTETSELLDHIQENIKNPMPGG